MKKMMKMAATVVALCFVSFPMMAQRVGSVSPAEDAFRGAFYDRAVVLSQRQMVDADILREKALQCSKLTIEMNAFLSIGRDEILATANMHLEEYWGLFTEMMF